MIISGFCYYYWQPTEPKAITEAQKDPSQPTNDGYSEAWRQQHTRTKHSPQEQRKEHEQQGKQESPRKSKPSITIFPPKNQDPDEFYKQLGASGSRKASFLPLTWMTKRQPEPYTSRDPEWKAFTELSQDPKAIQKVQDQLVSFCYHAIMESHEEILDVTGTPLGKFKAWVDVTYPQMKPARYERSGLVWIHDGIWKNKVLYGKVDYDGYTGRRFASLLWPDAFLKAAYEAGKFGAMWYYEVIKNLVVEPPKVHPGNKSSADIMSELRAQHKQDQDQDQGPQDMTSLERAARKLGHDLHLDFTTDHSAMTFQRHFSEEWSRSRFALPLGVCRFSGTVGLHGPDGHCKIAVDAFYLPKEKTFYSINLALMNLWPYSQHPGRRYPTDSFEDD